MIHSPETERPLNLQSITRTPFAAYSFLATSSIWRLVLNDAVRDTEWQHHPVSLSLSFAAFTDRKGPQWIQPGDEQCWRQVAGSQESKPQRKGAKHMVAAWGRTNENGEERTGCLAKDWFFLILSDMNDSSPSSWLYFIYTIFILFILF